MIRQVRGDGGGEVRHHPFNGTFVLIQVIQYSESGSHIEGVPSPGVKILGGPTAKREVNHADQPIHSQLFRLGLQPIIQRSATTNAWSLSRSRRQVPMGAGNETVSNE